jgi:hypothetical protein
MKRLLPLLLWCATLTASAQTFTHADSLMLRAQQFSKQKDYPAAISAYQQVVHERTAKPRYKAVSLYELC